MITVIDKVKKVSPGTKVLIKEGGYGSWFATGLEGTVVSKPKKEIPAIQGPYEEAVVFIKLIEMPNHHLSGKIVGLHDYCTLEFL